MWHSCALLLLSVVACARAADQNRISVKKVMYVEASVSVNGTVSKERLADTLSELTKVICLPGDGCQESKASPEAAPYRPTERPWSWTTYTPFNYDPSRRPSYGPYAYSTGRPYPYSTERPYPYSTGRPYPYSTGRPYPYSTGRPYPYSTERQYPYSTFKLYPYSTGRPYPYSTDRPYPHTTERPYPYSTGRPWSDPDYDDSLILEDCSDLPADAPSGVYKISISSDPSPVEVFCDMETDGGNWTVIQYRNFSSDPHNDFNKTWGEYRNGFGNVSGSYWLGNERIYAMTRGRVRSHTLRIDMIDASGNVLFANYGMFHIAHAREDFRLFVKDFSGDSGDGLSPLSGVFFSAVDNSIGQERLKKCPRYWGGGWWYKECSQADLNGVQPEWSDTLLTFTEMKIRP